MNEIFHPLHTDIERPERFTYPFNYTPHPLCLLAAGELQRYIGSNGQWRDEVEKGKMFGVLVVTDATGDLGFLAAYSGLLAGRNDLPYFVPSVYDSQQPDGYFKTHEREISSINHEIARIKESAEYTALKDRTAKLQTAADNEIQAFRQYMAEAKERRAALRASGQSLSAQQQEQMVRESQYQKAELRRIKKRWDEALAEPRRQAAELDNRIATLRQERKEKSDRLQQWLFDQYSMLNARGERCDLTSIFAATPQRVPPSGAGDCCAPKLLQYAYLHGLHPVCMAEFWWGKSPKTEIRHHLHYYPACRSKCKPILTHMLQGLNVDADPHDSAAGSCEDLHIVYEDESLIVVDKPAGILSVPGNVARESVVDILRRERGGSQFLMPAHRLDMATSGLLVVAKSDTVLRNLHEQFASRTVEKRYRAILDGIPQAPRQGVIRLPLAADPTDRPRQVVDQEHGKPAETRYEIISTADGKTEILLYPLTGRTHQLRVHCAHADGLATPILGDTLYGHPTGGRMYLHAEYVSFHHPLTGKRMELESRGGLHL